MEMMQRDNASVSQFNKCFIDKRFTDLLTIQMYNLNQSLWIKASAKCINVNVKEFVL